MKSAIAKLKKACGDEGIDVLSNAGIMAIHDEATKDGHVQMQVNHLSHFLSPRSRGPPGESSGEEAPPRSSRTAHPPGTAPPTCPVNSPPSTSARTAATSAVTADMGAGCCNNDETANSVFARSSPATSREEAGDGARAAPGYATNCR